MKKVIQHGGYLGTYKVPAPAPYILHSGERVLNKQQTQALAKLEKSGKVSLPKGAKVPQKASKTEVKKILTMMINNTKRGKKK